MTTDAPRYGQQGRNGKGKNGKRTTPITALPAMIKTVFVKLSDSDLSRIFQLACRAAAKRMSKTIPHCKFLFSV
jgi:hypothetical protein